MFVVWVTLIIQLYMSYVSARRVNATAWCTHKFEDGDLHHALIEVSRLVLHHFHRHDLMRLHVLAFDHLSKRSLAEDVQN